MSDALVAPLLYVYNTFTLEKTSKVAHLGQMIKEAIKNSSYTVRDVAQLTGLSESTLYRMFKVPNVGVREIALLSEHCQKLNLKQVYAEAEKILGVEIPDNPYRSTFNRDPGITITLDSKRWAKYEIPPDLIDFVIELIERHNNDREDLY